VSGGFENLVESGPEALANCKEAAMTDKAKKTVIRRRSLQLRSLESQHTWVGLVVLLVVALLLSPEAMAARILGPCEWKGERCHRTVAYALTPEELAFNRAPGNLRSETQIGVRRDLAPRSESRVHNEDAPVGQATDQAGVEGDRTSPGELELMSKPWTMDHYTAFVKLVIEFPSQPMYSYGCSGVLIGSHTVLTAGHCVYFHPEPGEPFPAEWADSVVAYAAADGESSEGYFTPYGGVEAVDLASNSWWTDYMDFDGDWAIVRLEKNVGEYTDWAALKWGNQWPGAVHYAGYPGDDGYSGDRLYGGQGDVLESDSYLICHDGQTAGGMSGGGTWAYESGSGKRTVRGNISFQYVGTNIHCSVLYNDVADEARAESEAVPTSDLDNVWTCEADDYFTADGCHCDCGLSDPDCEDSDQDLHNCGFENSYCAWDGQCGCNPLGCNALGVECGDSFDDGCGGLLDCGTCNQHPNSYCDSSDACECALDSCSSLGRECGLAADGCGGSMNCGDCNDYPNSFCASAGHCSCEPSTCQLLGQSCGEVDDGCGHDLFCGACDTPPDGAPPMGGGGPGSPGVGTGGGEDGSHGDEIGSGGESQGGSTFSGTAGGGVFSGGSQGGSGSFSGSGSGGQSLSVLGGSGGGGCTTGTSRGQAAPGLLLMLLCVALVLTKQLSYVPGNLRGPSLPIDGRVENVDVVFPRCANGRRARSSGRMRTGPQPPTAGRSQSGTL